MDNSAWILHGHFNSGLPLQVIACPVPCPSRYGDAINWQGTIKNTPVFAVNYTCFWYEDESVVLLFW